jgi:cold shock CspA family protein
MTARQTGTLKLFNEDRHFGFLAIPNGGDVFVSERELPRSISVGQRVSFSIGLDHSGRVCAVDVRMDHGAR